MSKHFLAALMTLTVVLPGAALADHGKAGLWNVTSTTDMAMATKPGAQAMKMPTAHSVHMCMSQAEVDSDTPPHIDQNNTGCETRILSQTPASMAAETTCNGSLKGTGHMQVSYSGAEHYKGTYDFKGSVEGNPTEMSTSFSGDWIKADCGSVRPYELRTH